MLKRLIFLSKDNMDGKTLYPRIPENYFTKNGFEDNKTKRVCFAPSIDKALMGLSMRVQGMILYVHIPDDNQKLDIRKPTKKEVPDCSITGETWVLNNVKLKCIGKIEVINDAGEDGLKFTYGDKTAELYRWEWKWLENKGVVNEKALTSKQRKKLDDDIFGVPELRKYPLTDKNHVLQAMRFFDKCEDKYKKELALNIIKRARELNMGINLGSNYYKAVKNDIEHVPINEGNAIFNPSDYIFTREDLYHNISKFAYGDMYDIDMVDPASEAGRGSLFIIRKPPDNFITEAAIERKFKCPFCDEKDTKPNLVTHVQDEHEDMIPQGYTAARVVYNYINKTDGGHCIYCKGETAWDEDRWKYKRICIRPACRKKASDIADSNMKKRYGKTHLLNDPDQQNKMLAGRKISGEYNFKGHMKSYVGTYELKLLEFYDKVLNVQPEEIQTPGPVVEYTFKGKKHQWITDLYYVTANLVHDAKDGGDNPNNREMKEYREKQEAKEDAIRKQGKYNYVRVTNNQFEQLLDVLSELKQMMIDDDIEQKTIIKINEYMAIASINPMIGSGACIVNYGVNGQYAGQAFTKDKFMSTIYMIDPETSKVEKKSAKDISDRYDFEMYMNNDIKDSKNIITQIESVIEEGREVSHDFFYKLLTGNELLDESQLANDIRFTRVLDAYSYLSEVTESIKYSLLEEYKQYIGEPILALESNYSNMNSIFSIMEDINGYYVQNTINNHRSRYYDNISEIPSELNAILR